MIKHRSPKIVLTVLGLFAFLIIPFNTVHAQTPSQAISLSPATTQVSIDPGKSASDKIEVINTGDDSFNVTFSVAPYYVTGQNYDPHFTQLPGTVDASKWITITSTKATLESHKVLAENYTISVPANTAPGGYYAVIFAETSQSNVSAGGVVPPRDRGRRRPRPGPALAGRPHPGGDSGHRPEPGTRHAHGRARRRHLARRAGREGRAEAGRRDPVGGRKAGGGRRRRLLLGGRGPARRHAEDRR